MQKVFFSYADKKLKYAQKTALKHFTATLFSDEQVSLHRLDYVFCSDEYLLRINQQHLNHDYYTDIITFNLSEGTSLTGEIYISLDRVKENAALLNHFFDQELIRVVFHGALHLCGYKDKKKSEITEMRNREEHYMRLYQQTLLQS